DLAAPEVGQNDQLWRRASCCTLGGRTRARLRRRSPELLLKGNVAPGVVHDLLPTARAAHAPLVPASRQDVPSAVDLELVLEKGIRHVQGLHRAPLTAAQLGAGLVSL